MTVKTIIDVETGEVLVRPLNKSELLQVAAMEAEDAIIAQEKAAAEAAKASALAKLAALGLTESEIDALLA